MNIQKVISESIHTEYNATKAANSLVRHFGAIRHRKFNDGSITKYNSHTTRDLSLAVEKAHDLHVHLVGNGWKQISKSNKGGVPTGTYKHPDGGHIDTWHQKEYKHVDGQQDPAHVNVQVWGSKKAAPYTLPYYD